MNLARILYPVRVLGPGERVGLWLCGCSRGCKGCSNPELWERRDEYEIDVDKVVTLVDRLASDHEIDGFTISGGEPMDQVEELSKLILRLKPISDDILIYSGYRLGELQARRCLWTEQILKSAAVLIDGAYVEELNDGAALRGSSNQKVNVLNEKFTDRYRLYFENAHNQIQNFTTSDGVVSVGIHHRGFSASQVPEN